MSNNPKSASNRLAALWKEQPKKAERPVEELLREQDSVATPVEIPQADEDLPAKSSSEDKETASMRAVPFRKSLDYGTEGRSAANRSVTDNGPAVVEAPILNESEAGFKEFERRWAPILRQGQMKVCETIYKNTIAIGRAEYDTSLSRLGNQVGLQVRQIRNLLGQLQAMGFVEREEITQNQRSLGTRIRFFLEPRR